MSPADLGGLFRAEIFEQPLALERLLAANDEIARIAAIARERNVQLVRMVGHGSSDNAASYGVYAFGLLPHWTAVRDSITHTVHYDTPLDLSGSMVVGLSQSGQTPDVLEYVQRARRAGAFTVAITNDPGSDLAVAAEATIPLGAGPELAVAATKTYVNTLALPAPGTSCRQNLPFAQPQSQQRAQTLAAPQIRQALRLHQRQIIGTP